MRMRPRYLAVLSVALITSAHALFAASISQFNQLVVLGDSLSDDGNVDIATSGQFPGSNYAPGRYTDGPNTSPATNGPQGLWVDQFAARTGITVQPFLAGTGGTDYAFASAETGSNGQFDVSDQLGYYAAQHPSGASSTAIYALWAGANDIFDWKDPKTAADNIYKNILSLAAAGGKEFVWINLPPLGGTPFANSNKEQVALNAATTQFNNEYYTDVQALKALGINIVSVDVNNLFTQIATNPSNYGFTNVTDSAQNLTGINPDNYLFWDDVHPTAVGHELVANLVYSDLTASPEPMDAAPHIGGPCGIIRLESNAAARPLNLLSLRSREYLRRNAEDVFPSGFQAAGSETGRPIQ